MFRGYKAFRVTKINDKICLVSPSQKQEWIPGENTSICRRCLGVDEHCTCGIYALRSPDPRLLVYGNVIGEILMWGKLIVGEEGVRAKKAQVSVLFLPFADISVTPEQREELALRYHLELIKAPQPLLRALEKRRNANLKKAGINFSNTRVPRLRGGYSYQERMEDYGYRWSDNE